MKQERPPKKPVCDADAAGAATTNLGKTAVSAVELDVEDESGMCIKSSDNPNTILKKELAAALDTIKELKEENNALKKQNCDLKADNEKVECVGANTRYARYAKAQAGRLKFEVAVYHPHPRVGIQPKGIIYMNLRAGSSSGKADTLPAARL